MRSTIQSVLLVACAIFAAVACAPEVGSKRWCTDMEEKPKGDWSTNEALDYARHCVFPGEDQKP